MEKITRTELMKNIEGKNVALSAVVKGNLSDLLDVIDRAYLWEEPINIGVVHKISNGFVRRNGETSSRVNWGKGDTVYMISDNRFVISLGAYNHEKTMLYEIK